MKFFSRKLVTTFVFGILVPLLFKLMNISDSITLASIALGGAYYGANVLDKKWKRSD